MIKKVTFPNKNNLLLSGRLHLPTKPIFFALYAHCFTCGKDIKVARSICDQLAIHNIATLRFDFEGIGESQGQFIDTNFSTNISDLESAATFLSNEYHAPNLLIGHSLGGTAALASAIKIPSIKAVSTINSPFQPSHVAEHMTKENEEILWVEKTNLDIMGKKIPIKKQFIDDLYSYNMENILHDLDTALLIFHAPHDKVVNIKNAHNIFSFAKHPKSFISLENANHLLSNANYAQYAADNIFVWASQYISLTHTL